MTGTKITRARYTLLTALLLIVAILLSGCTTIQFAADYDQIVDQTVTDLQASTSTFFARMKTSAPLTPSFYEENKQFFDDSRGIISALVVRASVLEEGLPASPLTDNFQDLQGLFDEMEKGVKPDENGQVRLRIVPMIKSTEEAFNQAFRAIITHMVFLKKKVVE